MNNWRILPLTIADQQRHIEQAESLLSTVRPGERATLSWSMAEPAGVVLGFSQKPDILNATEQTARSLPIYHRRAGGTAVLVGPGLLSLDVVIPTDHPLHTPDVIASYRWFGAAWVATLRQFGIDTRLVTPDEAHAQQARRKTDPYEALLNRACYGSLSPYEVVVGARKVVGLCMVRRRNGTLLQAGVVLHWDPRTLALLLGQTAEEQALLQEGLSQRAVGIDTLVQHVVTNNEIIAAFESVVLTDERLPLATRTFWSSDT